MLIIYSSRTFHILQPGERGVIFKPYTIGYIKEAVLVVIAPWNQLIIYKVKEQAREETMDITVRFNPIYNLIGQLHQKFGIDYINELVIPEIRSVVLSITRRYIAEELFSTKRKEVENLIEQETSDVLKNNNIELRALLIRSITLPPHIKEAIGSKLKQEQGSVGL